MHQPLQLQQQAATEEREQGPRDENLRIRPLEARVTEYGNPQTANLENVVALNDATEVGGACPTGWRRSYVW